jgi:hypothetical protein
MSQVLSYAAIAEAWYSASVVNKDTVGCLLLHQEIGPHPSIKTYSVVERRVS